MSIRPGGRGRPTIRQLVLQPTPYCNIDCRYCYLTTRSDRGRMSLDTLRQACRRVFGSPYLGADLEVIWHAGEPLAVPVSYYESAFSVVREEAEGRQVRHAIQTNGLLIDEAWCDFFLAHRVSLGLSIDGPARFHDRYRVTRSGRGTHAGAIEAVATLRRKGVPFSVIAVLTREALGHPDEFHQFFESLGARSVGFNIEETEAGHVSEALGDPDLIGRYRRFMSRLAALRRPGGFVVRELESLLGRLLRGPGEPRSPEASPLEILSVDWQGNLSTFSPELLGVDVPGLGPFRFGNVAEVDLDAMLEDERFLDATDEILRGVAMCREGCEYFAVCGGGAPANKLSENGSFASTETFHCITKIKVNTEILLDHLESRVGPDHPHYRHVEESPEPRDDDPPPGADAPTQDPRRGGRSAPSGMSRSEAETERSCAR